MFGVNGCSQHDTDSPFPSGCSLLIYEISLHIASLWILYRKLHTKEKAHVTNIPEGGSCACGLENDDATINCKSISALVGIAFQNLNFVIACKDSSCAC